MREHRVGIKVNQVEECGRPKVYRKREGKRKDQGGGSAWLLAR